MDLATMPPRAGIGTAAFSEVDLVSSLCRDSFYFFVREMWSTIIAEEPLWNWHVEYLCNTMQAAAERVFRREPCPHDYIINVPPGTTKSTIISIMFPAWVWCRMPSARFITASYTQDLAWDLARKSRELIQSKKYQACFPNVRIKDDQNTKSYFVNSEVGFRKSIGVGTRIIGFHAHFLLIDDPIDPQGTISDDITRTVNSWMTETLSSRKVDKAVSVTVLIMQRLAQNDPSGYLLDKYPDRYKLICLPAEIREGEDSVRPRYLVRKYINGLLDPIRMSRWVLAERLQTLLDFGYACQFLQTPIPRGGGKFQTDKLTIEQPPNPKTDIVDIVRYWDKAGTLDGGTFTVGVKMCRTINGRFGILDVIRVQLDSGRREALIKQTAACDGYDVRIGVEQEPGSGGKESAEGTVRNLAGYMVTLDRPHGKKESRPDTFSVQVNIGNVFLAPGAWNREYISELQFWPYSTYKDQADCTAGAFSMVVEPPREVGAF